ncbi:MAG TPA: hypothetical protein VGB55_10690 [Tepidisphaeraceae bacterium]|jgi:hypothetical protein
MEQTIQRWQSIAGNADLVHFVAGMFHKLVVDVTDRREQFTVVHDGTAVQLRPGVDGAADFAVAISSFEADRLADEAQRSPLGEVERFRIVRALFTAATAATLKQPRLASPLLRKLMGAESLIHVRLKSPVPEEDDATHTLIYAARQWLVILGLHGRAQRRYEMTVDQAADYQRHVHDVLLHDTPAGWLRFGRWYRQWRPTVSTTQPA